MHRDKHPDKKKKKTYLHRPQVRRHHHRVERRLLCQSGGRPPEGDGAVGVEEEGVDGGGEVEGLLGGVWMGGWLMRKEGKRGCGTTSSLTHKPIPYMKQTHTTKYTRDAPPRAAR